MRRGLSLVLLSAICLQAQKGLDPGSPAEARNYRFLAHIDWRLFGPPLQYALANQ